MGLVHNEAFSPENLVRSFVFHNEVLGLKSESLKQLRLWANTRKTIYDFVNGPDNQPQAMMLFRALGFAAKENQLPKSYFYLTDYQAFEYLKQDCNPKTAHLMNCLEKWIFYPTVFEHSTPEPSDSLRGLCKDKNNRMLLADKISSELGVEPEMVCVLLGKAKGHKIIDLPLVGENQAEQQLFQAGDNRWEARVFIHPSIVSKTQVIRDYMNSAIK